MNTKIMTLALTLLFATQAIAAAPAPAERSTKPEAVAMVKKGVTYAKSNGADKAFAEFSRKGGQFTDRDLYLVAYGLDGTVRAHGANEKMVGKNLLELKDMDGKAFVKERVELARKQGTFWQDYKFSNPLSKKVEDKSMYCEKVDDYVICGGVYR